MTAALDTADPQQIIAELRRQLDEALAQRSSDDNERIAHQAATNDVLKAMAASPGDPRPVFDLIVHRARELCNAYAATLYGFNGNLIDLLSSTSFPSRELEAVFRRQFPMAPTRGAAFGRAILDGEVAHIRDVDADLELSQPLRNLGLKSMVAVPLLRQGVVIGVITANAKEPGGFSDSQMELLETFGEQAVIAITGPETYRELHQRTSDLKEALEQQTATAEVLQVINSSPGDLAPIFDALLAKATTLCETAFGILWVHDGERFSPAAVHGPDALVEFYRNEQLPPIPGVALSRHLSGEDLLESIDLATDPLYQQGHVGQAFAKLGGAHSAISLALRKDRERHQPAQPWYPRRPAPKLLALDALLSLRWVNQQHFEGSRWRQTDRWMP